MACKPLNCLPGMHPWSYPETPRLHNFSPLHAHQRLVVRILLSPACPLKAVLDDSKKSYAFASHSFILKDTPNKGVWIFLQRSALLTSCLLFFVGRYTSDLHTCSLPPHRPIVFNPGKEDTKKWPSSAPQFLAVPCLMW